MAADHRKLVDDFGLAVVTWRNSKKGPAREAAHRESLQAKRALMAELDGLRQLADEYDACIRHMDAGGDFHEFVAARAREFEQAQQDAAGVSASAPDKRRPWQRTDWSCARARVGNDGLHCPEDKCADCPNRTPGVKGTDHG